MLFNELIYFLSILNIIYHMIIMYLKPLYNQIKTDPKNSIPITTIKEVAFLINRKLNNNLWLNTVSIEFKGSVLKES